MLGSVDIKVRPLKLAMLVDPGSRTQIRNAIRLASSLWGGMYFPIITLHKRMPTSWNDKVMPTPPAKSVISGYIEAFDPDVLVQFAKILPPYIKDLRLKIITPEEVWGYGETKGENPAFGVGVIDILEDIYEKCFKYTARYPQIVIKPVIPRKNSLFWAGVFGEYPDHISKVIKSYFNEPMDIKNPEISPDEFMNLTDSTVLFPRRITAWGLEPGGLLRHGKDSCIYFMDAGNAEDVVDYWNLRATGRFVLPFPKQFIGCQSFESAAKEFIVQQRRAFPSNPNHFDLVSFIRSRHSTMEEMSAFAATLKFEKVKTIGLEQHNFLLQHWYPRIWDEWARSKDGGVLQSYGEGEHTINISNISHVETQLIPLLPVFVKKSALWSEYLCVNEVDIRLYGAEENFAEVYPRSGGENLEKAIGSFGGLFANWRVGQHGLIRIIGSDFRSETYKVRTAEQIFFPWLADQGWVATLSPPGILAKEIHKRLDGQTRSLADISVLALIERMNGGSMGRDHQPILKSRNGSERELSVAEVKSVLAGKHKSARYEYFVKRGIFKLGWKAKCPICQRYNWFSLKSLDEILECPKCLNSFSSAGNIEQDTKGWHYRTTGPFSVPNFADGAFAVLITMDALSKHMFSFLRSTAVPSFTASSSGKKDLEADFAMFWKDSLYGEERAGLLFGECKTHGIFEEKDIVRMRYLGSEFPGAILVFSTLRKSITKEEKISLGALAKLGRRRWKNGRTINPVIVLTGNELLGTARPPHCWDSEIRTQFQRVHDILSFSDATQQIYLGLPPGSTT